MMVQRVDDKKAASPLFQRRVAAAIQSAIASDFVNEKAKQ